MAAESLWRALVVLLVAYLPGSLIFRVPFGRRSKRESLPAEERVFWSILLSVALSSVVALGLAAAGWYLFTRLIAIDAGLTAIVLALFRGRLRLGPSARPPTSTALVPLALVAAGLWLNFQVPPSEYIIGGKDPGIYMNEGIRIAQRGGLVSADEVVGAIPPPYRSLFFTPSRDRDSGYYSNRFMGFFLLDPGGTVVGQFPHLFPTWIAIAYGIDGLSGARAVMAWSAVLGLLAVYFAGARIMGRAAAAAGAALLAVNVVQIWYARYPNAEIVMQPLIFAGLLAYTRAVRDDDRFFAPVAALLFVLGVFTHLTGVLAVGAVMAAALLVVAARGRVGWSFWLPLIAGTLTAAVYLWRYIPPYFNVPLGFVRNLQPAHLALVAAAALAGAVMWLRGRALSASRQNHWISAALVAAIWTLAAYALFIRKAGGALAVYDADSLRTFASFYLSPYGLAAALVGFALVARSFADGSAFLLTFAVFSAVSFYKIRIVPEHFWAARRFLAVILPGALLLVGAAAFYDVRVDQGSRFAWIGGRGVRAARYATGLALVLLIGWRFLIATQPILHHVEYAGLIPHLEKLAATFGDDDLVLVESRGASDSHVLALPLAYIYARNVLVFAATDPQKDMFREFLAWASGRYRRVFFMGGGGGGTELLSRSMTVTPVLGERFQVPEYESAWNAYPRTVRQKEFDLSVYEFLPKAADIGAFDLDVGAADDLYVRRFYAKEQSPAGFTFRWTRDISFVSIVGARPEQRTLSMWMGAGGRPPAGGPAVVQVSLRNQVLGTVTVGEGMEPYRFEIPPELAATIAQSEDAVTLHIDTRTWNPARVIGGDDDRDLGVMLDRIEVR